MRTQPPEAQPIRRGWAAVATGFVLLFALLAPAPGTTTATPTPAPPAAGAVVRAEPVAYLVDYSYDTRETERLRASRTHPRTPVLAAKIAVPKPKPKPKPRLVVHHYSAVVPIHFGTAYLVAMAKCIRSYESGVYNRNSGNGYYGAYQMGDAMWHSQTHLPGHASDYSKAVQDYWFMTIWAKLKTTASKLRQWPTYRHCEYIQP